MGGEQSDLVTWLAELEAEHAARALVIASVRQRLGQPAGSAGSSALGNGGADTSATGTAQIRGDTFFQLKIPEAIKKYLGMMKRPQKPNTIAAALKQGGVLTQGSNFYGNVFTGLKRLREAGTVVRNKEGWGLAEWYKGMGKPTPPPVAKKKRRHKRKAKGEPDKAPAPPRDKSKVSTYRDLVAARRKEGKSMQEIGAEWRARNADK